MCKCANVQIRHAPLEKFFMCSLSEKNKNCIYYRFDLINSKEAGACRKCAFAHAHLRKTFPHSINLNKKLNGRIFSDKNMIQSDTVKLYQFE